MFKYTDEMKSFAMACYAKMSIGDSTTEFNKQFGTHKTAEQLRGALKSWGFRNGRGPGEIMKGKYKLFNQEQVEFIKKNYPKLSRKNLLDALNTQFLTNFTLNQLTGFVKYHKIQSGRSGHFKKGQASWSKGTKGILKANAGSFKKGRKAHNWVPVGSERINSLGYHDIKTAEPNKWESKHTLLWQKHNGPIPKGSKIRFKDGDKNNITIENLLLANDIEHVLMNTNKVAAEPAEIRDSAILLTRIQAKHCELSKGLNQ